VRGKISHDVLPRAGREAGAFPEVPTFQRYEVRDVLGEGATSIVYSAWDRELHRPVAIKLLRESVGLSDLSRQRFRREAQAAAGMAHPNVVTLYDAGEQDGRPYLVLELVEGKSLSETLQNNRGFRREHVELLAKAARGAGAVHAKGIVHRDLKPGNILVTARGRTQDRRLRPGAPRGDDAGAHRAGATLGTPYTWLRNRSNRGPGKDHAADRRVRLGASSTRS
jgi:serine/threonine-protein kinase